MFIKAINTVKPLYNGRIGLEELVAVVERKPMSKGSETRVSVWTVHHVHAVVERWPLVEVRLYISFVGF